MSEIYSPGSIVGPVGPPTTFMGVYDASVTYSIGEAVSSGGSSYVSLINSNTGNAPTSSANWALLAAAGAAGAAGNPGTNGAASVSQIAPMINAQFPALRNLFDPSQVQGSAGLASWQPITSLPMQAVLRRGCSTIGLGILLADPRRLVAR